jgi:3-phosphoshikimate 1-carboxyvinyltransferase
MKVASSSMIRGEVIPPPDKSITHRAFLFGAISNGKCIVHNPLNSADTLSTLRLVKSVGASVEKMEKSLAIVPPIKLHEPSLPIDCGNSGTTARIGMGLLARENIFSVLYGDKSLSKRPMKRVTTPLNTLGATFDGRNDASNLPISIRGGNLHASHYVSELSSGQVKSAFIFAALAADGNSSYVEKVQSRDHTERFLAKFGLVKKNKEKITIYPDVVPSFDFEVVGDFSSAAFFLVLAVIHSNARLLVKRVGLNPTRTGLISILQRMGARIDVKMQDGVEPFGDVIVESSNLKGIEVHAEEIPSMIDEVPLIALLGAFAQGETVVHGAQELRKKESDRIKATVNILKVMGADIEELSDGFRVNGGKELHGAKITAFGDHRMAMLASIAGVCAKGVEIEDADCVSISYPSFFSDLKEVMK